MSPKLDDVMNTVATGIQQVIFSPFIPVHFQGFIFIHAEWNRIIVLMFNEIML